MPVDSYEDGPLVIRSDLHGVQAAGGGGGVVLVEVEGGVRENVRDVKICVALQRPEDDDARSLDLELEVLVLASVDVVGDGVV